MARDSSTLPAARCRTACTRGRRARWPSVAGRFAAEISLDERRSGAVGQRAERARAGRAGRARAATAAACASPARTPRARARTLRGFLDNELPVCDEAAAGRGAARAALPCRAACATPAGAGTRARVVCPGIGQGRVVLIGGAQVPPELLEAPRAVADAERERVRRANAAVRATLETRISARGPPEVEDGHPARAPLDPRRRRHRRSASARAIEAGRSAHAGRRRGRRALRRAHARVRKRLRARARGRHRGHRLRSCWSACTARACARRSWISPRPRWSWPRASTPRQFLALDKRLAAGAGARARRRDLARGDPGALVRHPDPDRRGRGARARRAAARGRRRRQPRARDPRAAAARAALLRARAARRSRRREERLARFRRAPARTRDGQALEVARERRQRSRSSLPAFARGADGIGLFRTEMLFMDRDEAPSEEEQFAIYLQAARAAAGSTVILRTFDVGGDKPVPYLQLRAGEESVPRAARPARLPRARRASSARSCARSCAPRPSAGSG